MSLAISAVRSPGGRHVPVGYRVGYGARSLEAGLLVQDCLLVLDEAHLCSPFAATLAAIERRRDRIATFAVIRMGATMAPATQLLRRMPGLSTDVEPEESSEARNPFR